MHRVDAPEKCFTYTLHFGITFDIYQSLTYFTILSPDVMIDLSFYLSFYHFLYINFILFVLLIVTLFRGTVHIFFNFLELYCSYILRLACALLFRVPTLSLAWNIRRFGGFYINSEKKCFCILGDSRRFETLLTFIIQK